MAITFLEKRRRLKYLFPVLMVVGLATGFILWWGFLKEEIPFFSEEPLEIPVKKIEINFQVLKNPLLEQFEPFEEIAPLEKEAVGRENPFVPY